MNYKTRRFFTIKSINNYTHICTNLSYKAICNANLNNPIRGKEIKLIMGVINQKWTLPESDTIQWVKIPNRIYCKKCINEFLKLQNIKYSIFKKIFYFILPFAVPFIGFFITLNNINKWYNREKLDANNWSSNFNNFLILSCVISYIVWLTIFCFIIN